MDKRYIEKAGQLKSRDQLIELWQNVLSGDTKDWESGKALVYLIVRGFQIEGLYIQWPYSFIYPYKFGQMEQIDGVVYCQGTAFIIEAKDHKEPLGIE